MASTCCSLGDNGSERVGDGFGDGRMVEVEDSRKTGDLASNVGGGHGGYQGGGGAQGVDLSFWVTQPTAPSGGFSVSDQVGQRLGADG
jgi:hypothetical protein